ncbi:RPUSD2 [Symbiodinium pilosum]|uniref:RPUSD2 protein n=1 Tax=Symbiodinium pilosum TaxID=2952 RepID=A0A812YDW0_SYMPI|nr:RPUSD2 [Symbiodinium pilosum]
MIGRVSGAAATGPEHVTYRVQGGLRHVEPYDFDFTTHVKQRWIGRTLLEVCACEFVAFPRDYYEASIEAGRVTVDGKAVKSGHVLRDGQRIVHRAVRCRENPVLDRGPIKVVADTKELLVVSKPSSLPIHPCGSYRFNSLIAILRNQGTVEAHAPLHTTHRLDRLTSGLVLLARTKEAARRVGAWFAANQIRKTYMARVQGCFGQLLEKGGQCLPAGATCKNGRIHVMGYIRCIDRKVGKYQFSAEAPAEGEDAKDAATEFEFVGMASQDESLVRCYPATGRTHQIRVHLLHLGFPIANDSCYGGELRNDSTLPLIPHIRQEAQSATLVEEATMHPSGIFLHALTYALPDGGAFTSEAPDWATARADIP